MKPIVLHGHTRPMTQLRYNKDGDLLFTSSKDSVACLWYSQNGERIGTYNAHTGSIWTLDATNDSKLLVTGSADSTSIVWDVETGKSINTIDQKSAVKRVEFSSDSQLVLMVIEKRQKSKGGIQIYKTKDLNQLNPNPTRSITLDVSRITVAGFGFADKYVICGHEDGYVSLLDWKNGCILKTQKYFEEIITDIQFSSDTSYCIVSSKDTTAKLIDCNDLSLLKVYKSETAVNSACITPVQPLVILGGGQAAADVTTTSSRAGNFEARFYHKILEAEMGKLKGHFGPINYLSVKPNGRSLATCGEDGFIRIQHFDPDFFNEIKI